MYRETVVSRVPTDPCVLVVGFRLRGVRIEREGVAVLPARLLLDVARALPSGAATLELRPSEGDVEVVSGSATFHIRTMRAEDCPPFHERLRGHADDLVPTRVGVSAVVAPLELPLGERAVVDAVRRHARPLTGAAGDYDALLSLVGDARLVLLGEASHGTHEFYRERARITQRLIGELGFTAVAIEGDWPDAHRVDRYVCGARDDLDAEEALRGFRRFPTWMWRNADVVNFVSWLREHNARVGRRGRRVRAAVLG